MNRPTKAVILAAGLGERMRPLSTCLPKAMMPFCGEPIIKHTIATLREWGVKDVLINLHHAPSPLVEYMRTHDFPGTRISYSFEPDIRGTGGALRQAEWFIGKNPFWIINSDIVLELDPAPLLKEFVRVKPVACLWVTPEAGPRTVDISSGKITCFRSEKPGTEGTATFCGVHLVSPSIKNYLSEKNFSSIIEAYRAALKAKKKIAAVEVKASYWADIGSPEKLLSCHHELAGNKGKQLALGSKLRAHLRKSKKLLLRQGVYVKGFVSALPDVSASRSSKLENCILGEGVHVGPNSLLSNCVVADGLNVTGNLSRAAVPFCAAFDREDIIALESKAWNAKDVIVEALPPRGSNRSFYRLYGAKQPAILIKYDPAARPENAKFTQNLNFINSLGIPVPALLLDLPAHNICIVEDLGDTSLQDAYAETLPHIRIELYLKLIRFTAALHSKGAILAKSSKLELEPPFGPELYEWEHNLFAEHYLKGLLELNSTTITQILKEMSRLPAKLNEPKVLVHRDLQSSNIMLKAGRPVFIDFQGMRLGSRYYDLASLLLDPYVCLSPALKKRLIKEYALITGVPPNHVERDTHIAGIQRLAQAIGAFSRLSKIEGMADFKRHIQPACRIMNSCMAYTLDLPVLADLLSDQSTE